jgi:hypothetical protein
VDEISFVFWSFRGFRVYVEAAAAGRPKVGRTRRSEKHLFSDSEEAARS